MPTGNLNSPVNEERHDFHMFDSATVLWLLCCCHKAIEKLHWDAEKPHVTIVGKGRKVRTLYLLPKAVAHLKKYLQEYGDTLHPTAYVFYSRNTGPQGKMSQTAVNKQLKKHARAAYAQCHEGPGISMRIR